MNLAANRVFVSLLSASLLGFGCAPHASAQAALKKPTLVQSREKSETLGGGTVSAPAVGPAPSFGLGGPGMVLVKNWRFGTNGTIKNQADLNANFLYHDQHKSIANGSNAYGSLIVAPDDAHAIFPGDVYYYTDDAAHSSRGAGLGQPIEGRDSAPVRQFTADSIKTFLTPLKNASTKENGVLTVLPDRHEVGNGSFMASWFLPTGGSLLGQDIVWETKVRYKTPPYFWFSLWTDGNKWRWDNGARGAEHDLIESYGEDYKSEGAGTASGNDNFDGHLWHSNSVAGSDTVNYFTGAWWGQAMADQKIKAYDASVYHIWTWVYKKDNSYAMYVDGVKVQSGTGYYWTFGNRVTDAPINMSFRFDGGWGHRSVRQVDKALPATALAGTYYEYAYSRVYLSRPTPARIAPVMLPGLVRAVNYMSGGGGVAYKQNVAGGQTLYRLDNSGADYGTALGWTAPGQWYKYKVVAPNAGRYDLSVQAGSDNGGTFHIEDETGRSLTGPVSVPKTGGAGNFATVQVGLATLSAGPHTLKWVQDTGGYDLFGMTFGTPESPYRSPHSVPGTVDAADYDLGGAELAYHQTNGGGQTGYRADNSGAANGPGLGWTGAGQWYKYTLTAAKAGSYLFKFEASSPGGGSFHVEDETGKNLTGPVAVPITGGYSSPQSVTVSQPVTLSAGTHTLKWVQDPASPVSLTAAVLSMLEEDLRALLIVCLDIDRRQISEEMSRIPLDSLPTVLILAGELSLPLPHVFYDNRSGGQQAALHLIGHGWPEISIIAPFRASWVSERIEGIRAAVPAHANDIQILTGDGRDWQVSGDPSPLGYETMRAALASGWRPSGGLVCVNDGVALGALRAAAEWGLEAGRDFGLLGFDDESRARVAGLTSLRPPMQSMAREAVRLLLDHRQGADTSLQVRLRAHVIPRASTRTRTPTLP